MNILSYFRHSQPQQRSAAQAKERLQILVAHERSHRRPDYLAALEREIVDVVRKYVHIGDDQVRLKRQNEGNYEVLEVNITLPNDSNNAS
ncbi:MAG: cell division topological specificity factor MinE [Candidatus Competibacterales bacterium]